MNNKIVNNRLNKRYGENKLESPKMYVGGKYVTRLVFAKPLQ
ncbi:hypothetical protein [Sporosarcina sp. FSL K6-1508]